MVITRDFFFSEYKKFRGYDSCVVVVSIYSVVSAVAAALEVRISDSAFPVAASEAAEFGIDPNIWQTVVISRDFF